ncbi:MAG: sugar ABC transporter substrate-binding protein [Porphyromonadaceae bacterium]|nr:MAG: sugar ABC transporter substrate-binding protein [Porphyromonadaceae bacterium]
MSKLIKPVSLVIVIILSLCCNRHPSVQYSHTIGVTYQNLQNEFVINIQDAMRNRAKELNVKLIEVDGQGKAENQISQVENFLALDVDAIILNPFDRYGSAPVVSIAKREGKPIVVVNAVVVNLDKADAYVGSNDQEAGRIAATYISQLLKGKGDLALIRGPNGHSAEIQRTEGILEILKGYPDLKIIFDQSGNWDRTQGLELMENWLSTGKPLQAVIAQNDEMALGAQKAIEAAGKQNDILVIGIDAIPDALRAVKDGKLCATVFQDARGQGILALELAVKLSEGKRVDHTNYIPFQLITKENLNK